MTGARTVWEFASAPPGEDDGFSTVPTFLDIDYGFELAAGGTVGPGPLSMDLRVAPSTGQATAQRIEELSVEVSADDGESWHVVQASRTGAASYRAMVNPSLFRWGSDHLSFRVSAVDAAGNGIEQTTHRLLEVG
jgi:hypothetical protein